MNPPVLERPSNLRRLKSAPALLGLRFLENHRIFLSLFSTPFHRHNTTIWKDGQGHKKAARGERAAKGSSECLSKNQSTWSFWRLRPGTTRPRERKRQSWIAFGFAQIANTAWKCTSQGSTIWYLYVMRNRLARCFYESKLLTKAITETARDKTETAIGTMVFIFCALALSIRARPFCVMLKSA